jgi:hypothetical protein
MGAQPASEDFDGDTSGYAEDAQERGQSWYDLMRSLRQTMLNLLAAGLFHLIEQQLGVFAKIAEHMGISIFQTPKVVAPMAGEDLFVTEDLLKKYAEAAESFFREIAAYFEAHENEYY